MESNGISYATLSPLMDIFEYENICHIGGNPKTSIGINSNSDRKLEACLNFKEIWSLEDGKNFVNDLYDVYINIDNKQK